MTPLKFGELEGRMVLDKGGREIGVLTGIDIDVDDWRVTNIEVMVNKDVLEAMGTKRPVFGTLGTQTITVPIAHISRTSDAILLETELPEVLFTNKDE